MIPNNIKQGTLIHIFMISKREYFGALRKIDAINKIIEIVSPSGDYYYIANNENIEAYSIKVIENKPVVEKNPQDEIPQHKPGDINSLLELRKMKANEDLKQIRQKLLSNKPTAQQVEYASTANILSAIKKYTTK